MSSFSEFRYPLKVNKKKSPSTSSVEMFTLGREINGPWLHTSGKGFTDNRVWAWRGTRLQLVNMKKLLTEPLKTIKIKEAGTRQFIGLWNK